MPLKLGVVYTRATLRDAIEDWSVEAKWVLLYLVLVQNPVL